MDDREFKERIALLMKEQREHMDTLGFSMIGVFGGSGEPGFTYTIGMYRLGVPELIVWGLPHEHSASFCWMYYEKIKAGWKPSEWEISYDFAVGYPACFRTIREDVARDCLTASYRHAQEEGVEPQLPMALVWTDTNGLFPWDPNFEERFRKDQPEVWASTRN